MIRCNECNGKADKLLDTFGSITPLCDKCYNKKMNKKTLCTACKKMFNKYKEGQAVNFCFAVDMCNSCYNDERYGDSK